MQPSRFGGFPLAACLVAVLAPAAVSGQVADPDPARFSGEIDAFASWDAKNYAPRDAVVFVGSSSIRFWPTAERFPGLELVNRGFGGAHISDVNHFVEETVLRYGPDVVVFYAGDNDMAAGKDARRVLADYRRFTETVLASEPDAQIVWLPIKPSLARWELWRDMQEANALVRELSDASANLHYADVATPMLGSDGTPMPELFVQDGLHMTPAGYDIWTDVLRDALAHIR